MKYPKAISFASGRPADIFFDLEDLDKSLDVFVNYYANKNDIDSTKVNRLIAQYGRTSGLINEIITKQIDIDENIHCNESQIVVTSGCQEAMAICLDSLFKFSNDVLVVFNPTYIGITGLAELKKIQLDYISLLDKQDPCVQFEHLHKKLAKEGKIIKAIYLIPDFDNPTGYVFPLDLRKRLLSFCAQENIFIIEDNPYGLFRYEEDKIPSFFQLDYAGCVLHLGTYAKTLSPAMRTGYILVPETLFGNHACAKKYIDELSEIKSFLSINTSQLLQAIVGGTLLQKQCSLKSVVKPIKAYYKNNRDIMLATLNRCFSDFNDLVSWNTPTGGFFLNVKMPFDFKHEEVERCAKQQNVLCMPLSFFALDSAYDNQIRLSFSYANPVEIEQGVESFAQFVKERLITTDTVSEKRNH